MTQHAVIIDHESCWGCKACEVACKQENNIDAGVKLIRVSDNSPKKVDGKLEFIFNVNACTQCDEFPCADVCAFEAIMKRPDSIVILDEDLCTGCELCIDVCPEDAMRYNENSDVVQKCNLCYHRVDKGLIPACADNVCLAHCIYFGDPDEIQKQIESVHAARHA
jgi:Fe-S-cluster-containing dehydrogenase component